MTNKEIYRKTLPFSYRRFLLDTFCFLLLGLLGTSGFLVMDRINNKGLIGLGVGLVVGLIILVFLLRYGSYTYKAAHIAMMTKGLTENQLPDNVVKAGIETVRERFATITLFFIATDLIKGIFRQLGRGLNAIGSAIGGDTGSNIASVIETALNVLIGFLCDCCLGWVFYRKEIKASKATCEGAAIFFKHGKPLLKNLGRMFGMGLASLVVIGGGFTGVFYLIFSRMPATFERLIAEVSEASARLNTQAPAMFSDTRFMVIFCAALAGILLWSILHSVFVRPFILVGVLRNFMAAGVNDIPTEASFAALDSKSEKFRKLHAELA